jgi:hypothetical protein
MFGFALRRDHDDRQLGSGMALPQPIEDFDTAQVGHHIVQQDQVEPARFQKSESLAAIFGNCYLVAVPLQPPSEHIPIQFVIIYHQERARSHIQLLSAGVSSCAGIFMTNVEP